MVSMFWSMETEMPEYWGASSNWLGATSLWRVWIGTPRSQSSFLEVPHEVEDASGDGAEVVVVELLALVRRGAEQGAARRHEVGAQVVELAVDEEVLLLDAGGRRDARDGVLTDGVQHAHGGLGHGLARAQGGVFLSRA